MDRLDIHAYADKEFSPDEMARLEAEIAASPESARELDAIRSLKSCLQSKMQNPECSAIWKECAGRLDELDRVKKAESFVGKYAWALCALLFVVILGGGMLNRFRGGSVGMGQVASDISGMVPMQTVPSGSSQPEQLNSFINGPTLSVDPSRVQIVGYAYADQPEGRVKRVRLRDSIGFVDLLIIPNVTGVDGAQPIGDGMFAGQVNGLNCVIRPASGYAVLVMGDRDTSQLRDFALSMMR